MSETIAGSFSPGQLRELLQQCGYRAELMTDRPNVTYLRSATGGVPFEVQFVNRMPNDASAYADVSFVAVLGVQGEIPLALLNDWNNSRRFARLRWVQNLVVLDMDISALGGLTQAHLQAQIGIWDQLVQDMVPYLRNAFIRIAGAAGAPQGTAVIAPPADTAATKEA
jgi:hypothetical protein